MDQNLCLELIELRKLNEYSYKHPYHKFEIYKRPVTTRGLVYKVDSTKVKAGSDIFTRENKRREQLRNNRNKLPRIRYQRISNDTETNSNQVDTVHKPRDLQTSPIFAVGNLSP